MKNFLKELKVNFIKDNKLLMNIFSETFLFLQFLTFE